MIMIHMLIIILNWQFTFQFKTYIDAAHISTFCWMVIHVLIDMNGLCKIPAKSHNFAVRLTVMNQNSRSPGQEQNPHCKMTLQIDQMKDILGLSKTKMTWIDI